MASLIKMFLLFIIQLIAVSASAHFLPDGRIVGGEDGDIKDYPYQISLDWYGFQHICGGTIIDATHVVTAAHCTRGTYPDQYSVRAGSSILVTGGQLVNLSAIHEHPQYNFTSNDFDIAVLTLVEPLQFSDEVNSVDLPTQELLEGTEVTISGWGATEYGGEDAEHLQVVKVPIVNRDDCNISYEGKITENMICAGLPEGGKDSCRGDSGGPLVANGILYGVVSWGQGCGDPGYPGVSSNVVSLRDFIESVLAEDL